MSGKGSCADLEEIPNTKLPNIRRKDSSDLSSEVSTASGSSSLSSASGSKMSERAVRAAMQLQLLTAPKTEAAVVSSESCEKAASPQTAVAVASPDLPELDPRMGALVAEFKNKLMVGSAAPKQNPAGASCVNPDVPAAPEYVTHLHAGFCFADSLRTLPRFVKLLLSKVLAAVGGEIPKAFPLKSQYIAAVKNARSASQNASEPQAADDGRAAKRARVDESQQEVDQGLQDEPPSDGGEVRARPRKAWNYAMERKIFMARLRSQQVSISYTELVELWNASSERRALLGSLTVSELKKRKFLPKGATVNPWAGDAPGAA